MKKILFFTIIVAMLFSVFSCVSLEEKKDISVIHDIQNTEKYTTDIEIPVFENEEKLNTLISNQIDKWFKDFDSEMQETSSISISRPNGAFYVDWELKENSSDLISVLLSAYVYTGGANGEDILASFNWDKTNQKLISLEEILPQIAEPATLETLSDLCRIQLREILEVPEYSFLAEMINEGTKPIPDNFQIFTITKLGVNFYFTKYQVAPGSYGIQDVFLRFIR